MFKHLGIWAIAAAIIVPALADDKAADKATAKIRVLIVDGQNNHNWRATTPLMKKELESCGRFTVEVATSPQRPNAPAKPKDAQNEAAQKAYQEALAKYKEKEARYHKAMAQFHPDLSKYDVLLSNYNGDAWSKEFQTDLEERLKEGKIDLVIVHAANNSFGNWSEYNRMIGMGWRDNRFGDRLTLDAEGKEKRVAKGKGPGAGHGAYHPFLITLRDAEHPITKGMPREWMHAGDELYHGMRGPIENVHLLATAYDDKTKGGTGEHEPMIWTVSYGKGRVFHTPMGHDDRSMRCLGFVGTLQRGTEWAATGRVTLPLPKNFPTAEKTSTLDETRQTRQVLTVPYGKHPRQVLDFYQAQSKKPTPVVFHIHGGGWRAGDKKMDPKAFLGKGISVVSINYRYVRHGVEEKLEPPVKAPLEDAARALQFVRSKATEWNLDKKRIGATGGSAGGCSSLWLAFHDDMADPRSSDPIARESTRLYCAAVNGAQTSLDPKELREWMPNYGYGAHAFGLPSFQSLIDNREKVLKWIKEYSPIEHVSKDDPPIGLFYGGDPQSKVGDSPRDPTHSPILGIKLAEKLKATGVDVILVYPEHGHAKYKNSTDYLIDHLLH